MNLLELAVTERNRLTRLCIIVNIVAVGLAIWARDPRLNISIPFSGEDEGNITVGHAVVIGQPLVAILFLVFAAQLLRYNNLLSQLEPDESRHLDWRIRIAPGDRGLSILIRSVCEFFRWLAMICLPAIACGVLLVAQFEFFVPALEGKERVKFSISTMFDDEFYNNKLAYFSLDPKDCSPDDDHVTSENSAEYDKCVEENELRKTIRDRFPSLYQPLNFLIGAVLQALIVATLAFVTFHYFSPLFNARRKNRKPQRDDPDGN